MAGRPPSYVRFAVLGHRTVDASLHSLDIVLIDLADGFQRDVGVRGPVAAICDRHGSPTVLLALLRGDDDRALVVATSVDERALVRFQSRLRFWDRRNAGVVVSRSGSQPLPASELRRLAGGAPRLVLLAEPGAATQVERWLEGAADALVDGGILIVRHGFDESHPAGSEGLQRFLRRRTDVHPLLTGGNSTLLCHESFAECYRDRVFARMAVPSSVPWVLHENDFMGRPLLSFRPHDPRWALDFWLRFGRARLGRALGSDT